MLTDGELSKAFVSAQTAADWAPVVSELEVRFKVARTLGARELYGRMLELAWAEYEPLAECVASEGYTLPLDLPPEEQGFHGR